MGYLWGGCGLPHICIPCAAHLAVGWCPIDTCLRVSRVGVYAQNTTAACTLPPLRAGAGWRFGGRRHVDTQTPLPRSELGSGVTYGHGVVAWMGTHRACGAWVGGGSSTVARVRRRAPGVCVHVVCAWAWGMEGGHYGGARGCGVATRDRHMSARVYGACLCPKRPRARHSPSPPPWRRRRRRRS